MTALRLAELYEAFARPDGRAPRPWIVRPGRRRFACFRISPTTGRALRGALRAVVAPGGTAASAHLSRWDFMGKTGTAQNPQGPPHAWFAGLAGRKGHAPAIVAVAFIEHGGEGAVAARLVARVVSRYLTRLYGRAARAAGPS